MSVGGNTELRLLNRVGGKNSIGEKTQHGTEYMTLTGWLDMASGDTRFTSFNAAVTESTHIFMCDYKEIGKPEHELIAVDAAGKEYDVSYIDDPMGMHEHLEIYLRYTG
jgi:hypothetical protein